MPKWVKIDWPEVFPRPLSEVAKDLGWHVRVESGGPQICLDENYEKRAIIPLRPNLVSGEIGDPRFKLLQLATWEQAAVVDWARLRREVGRFAKSVALPERLYGLRLGFATAPASELPALVEDFLDNRLPELAGGRVLVVEADTRLYYMQLSVAKLLYRAVHHPHLFPRTRSSEREFEAGRGLDSLDIIGGELFLLAAAAAMSPVQVGFVASRVNGCLVLCYPSPVLSPESSLPRTLAELAQPHYFVRPRARLESPEVPREVDTPGFLSWWVERWNRLLGQLLDPGTHRDDNGVFSPALMLARFVSLERLLSCVQGILVETGQNEFVRMALLFDALDLFENMGVGLGSWEQLTRGKFVQAELTRLTEAFCDREAVAGIVLPRCRSAAAALSELRHMLLADIGSTDQSTGDRDVHLMLRALRNAGHGLTGTKGLKHLQTLMGKGAQIPADIPDLAWLHLMRLLCFASWTSV